ncbi:hypothetical protein [Brevibacillus agri]|uniref:hypothetical protein n=1 Tax=Brevibacillus agri TaxID=51101 RepID=UPI00046F7FC3|nr:hypothetical protein [Brevibacillus agri]
MATDVARLKEMRKEMNRLVKEAGGLAKEVDRTSRGMQRMTRQFSAGMGQMKADMQNIQNSLKELNQVNVKPKVEFGEVTSKLNDLKTELAAAGGLLAGLAMGTTLDGAKTEAQAAARERALYAARGKTEEEMKRFDELTKKLTTLNPHMKASQAMALIAKSENDHPNFALEAAKLGVTTRFAPEDSVKMMAAIGGTTDTDSAVRLANALQYMNNTGEGNLSVKLVESISQFNAQNGKLLNTPEKLAAVVGEIGKLSNEEKSFGTLLKKTQEFSGSGELARLLQSQYEAQGQSAAEAKKRAEDEAKKISQGLSSADKDEQRIALGKTLMSIAAMTDKAAQQKAMTSLGGNAGSAVEKTVKIAGGEISPQVGNEADKSYAAATKADPFFASMQAQTAAKNEAMEAIGKISSDLSGISTLISRTAEALTGWFNGWSDSVRQSTVYIIGTLAVGTAMAIQLASMWGKAKAFATATRDWWGSRGKKGADAKTAGGKSSPLDGGGMLAGGKGECCCCCDGSGAGINMGNDSGREKKRSKNATPSAGNKPVSDGAGQNAAPSAGNKPAPSAGNKPASNAAGKNAAPPDAPAPNKLELDSGGLGGVDKAVGKGSWKNMAKSGLRKLPFVGGLLSLATIAGSENKVETAAQVGTEALGGWGGAAAGAAMGATVGSIVPGIGTAIGGAIGGIIGGFGGSMLGSMAFDKATEWWQNRSSAKNSQTGQGSERPPVEQGAESRPASAPSAALPGQPAPGYSPAASAASRPQSVSLTLPQVTISLHAAGVLQDIPTMLKMLNDPSVGQRIRTIIEKALLDALETRGGVTT